MTVSPTNYVAPRTRIDGLVKSFTNSARRSGASWLSVQDAACFPPWHSTQHTAQGAAGAHCSTAHYNNLQLHTHFRRVPPIVLRDPLVFSCLNPISPPPQHTHTQPSHLVADVWSVQVWVLVVFAQVGAVVITVQQLVGLQVQE